MQIQSGWQGEPDKLNWVDRGVKCEIIRHKASGHLCGYIQVEPTLARKLQAVAEVHGGIGYIRKGCVGFDCGHDNDFKPYINSPSLLDTRIYRTVAYVTEELNNLVTQYLALKEPHNDKAA